VVADPGPLLARGRACDVYQLDEHRVLRRYRTTPYADVAIEAEIMERVRANGYPVPRVHEATATDLVMDRIEGPTMVEMMTRRPWQLRKHARTLASLHHQLHDIPAPETLDTPLGEGAVIVHLDLHPLNVIMSPDGPVVIDWSSAARGDGNADVALTYLMLMAANPDEGALLRLMARFGRALFARPFLAQFDREDVMAHLDAAATYKLADPNMSEAEQRAIRRLAATTRQ
jgi:aminoglycoside phosphotransferase (APT) family kinase protein